MPGATFVSISQDELIDFVEEHGFVEDRPWGKERCFTLSSTIGKMPVKLYFLSTLSVGSAIIRKVGDDCMKIWVMGFDTRGDAHRISYQKRFYRTKGWKTNLAKAFEEWETLVRYRCEGCGSPLVYTKAGSKQMGCVYCLHYKRR